MLRRLHLNVVGLPPSPAEQREFERNASPQAIRQEIDALLANPGYGERWTQHWLDLVRYADSNGYERDSGKPFAWRYRDYVIRSLNDDKPFDRFVEEEWAADLIAAHSAAAQIGHGIYLVGPWDDEPASLRRERYDHVDDIVTTTSMALLSLDVGCAPCHDHHAESITQRDYHGFAAIVVARRRIWELRSRLSIQFLPASRMNRVASAQESDSVAALTLSTFRVGHDDYEAIAQLEQTIAL